MEVKQKIETRILRAEDGSRLTLEYCLLARLEPHPHRALCAPFGMEITLRTPQGARTAVCRNLTENHRRALSLIHLFAARCVTPAAAPAPQRRAV